MFDFLEEMNELRLQVKILQEKNDSYMKCAIEVDEVRLKFFIMAQGLTFFITGATTKRCFEDAVGSL